MEDNYSPYLVLANVEVVHVDERDNIPILVLVEKDADLVERELNIESWRHLVQLVIHFDLQAHTVSRHSSRCMHMTVLTLPSPETGFSMN